MQKAVNLSLEMNSKFLYHNLVMENFLNHVTDHIIAICIFIFDAEMNQFVDSKDLFLPFRCFCTRKDVSVEDEIFIFFQCELEWKTLSCKKY